VRQRSGRELVKTFSLARFTKLRPISASSVTALPSPTEAELARTFQRTILPHLDDAYNLARFLTRDPVLSEDVVQDAIVRALRAFAQFRGESPRAWLLAIVRNCCRTAQPGTSGRVSLVADPGAEIAHRADPAPDPEQAIVQRAEITQVRDAIEAIPEPFRETVVLRDLDEFSYAEIAQIAGIPIGTVMSRLARGRAMLAKALLPAREADDEPARSAK